ncbi:hypothetical protein EJ08DRAFT_598492 [Tothia fuscella]|uniref:Uncharacterized protein n=1 Tax=Tothia fuscella TaxID=1048955 RepID=A0A9P4NGH2_9PEZI|nr:hypothetical protein EJ08DRAFT_598492 [Tothia fuscella]
MITKSPRPPLPNHLLSHPVLLSAIQSADRDRLNAILGEILKSNPPALDIASSALLVNGPSTTDDIENKEEPRKRYEKCLHCDEEYDVLDNEENSCGWHEGQLEPDYDSNVWDDWDEDCHGRIDDQEEAFPEGFVWNCCEAKGDDDEPCMVDFHVP